MPRKPRAFIESNTVQHVISRFVASEWFIAGVEERRTYLYLLGCALARSTWRCIAYAIMSNHIHLAMVAGRELISSWSRDVNGPFAEWINRRRNRIGAVFARGPTSRGVRPDGVATVIGYIHQNPVRAGVVVDPRDSDWTSHAAYAGRAKAPPWLDVELGLRVARTPSDQPLESWIRGTSMQRADADAALLTPPVPRGRRKSS